MIQLNWYKIFGESHQIPDGRTVTPTDDIQIWLHCADIWDKTYTTLVEVLADTSTLVMLMAIDNAVDYLVRSTTWVSGITTSEIAMKSIGASDYASTTLLADATWNSAIQSSPYFEWVDNIKVPAMTDNTHPYGVCSGTSNASGWEYWKAFDGVDSNSGWCPNTGDPYGTAKVHYTFPRSITPKKIRTYYKNSNSKYYKIRAIGSNDNGGTWTTLTSTDITSYGNTATETVLDANADYLTCGVLIVTGNATILDGYGLKVQYYGREIGGVQTWLRSANITDKTYTTLSEVLADSTTLSALMSNHNAVDYLVTCKGWVDDICADSTAMTYIGLNNYASNTLLADATWCNAICNSTYFESVLNVKVPTMTSNTTPSGVCGSTSVYYSPRYEPFKAVGTDPDYGWEPTLADSVNSRCWYQFTSAVKIYLADLRRGGTTSAKTTTMDIIASTDGSTWNTEVPSVVVYSGANSSFNNPTKQVITNPSTADYWGIRLLSTTEEDLTTRNGYKMQFYGRQDV